MSLKGVVTNVDTTFLFFELDGNVKVHMSILMSQNNLQALPLIGSEVVIENAHNHYLTSTYSVCKSSTLIGDFCVPRSEDTFLNLVQEHKFGIKDLFRVEEIIDVLGNNFKDLEQNLKIKLINSLVGNIVSLSISNDHPNDECLNKCMSEINIITSNSCKYVEIQSTKFNEYPPWSFGIHSNPTKVLLFGHLTMHPMYGFLLLKDKHYQIPCIFYNTTLEKFSQITDSYISTEKYKVITEIFQENKVPNVEYLLIDVNDVNIIYTPEPPGSTCLFGDEKPSGRSFGANMYFQLKRKSTIRIGISNAAECWFQILIEKINGNEVTEEAFLILPAAYIKIITNFKEELYYTLFHNTPLKVVNNPELTRVKKVKVYEIQESDAYFLKDNRVADAEKLLTVAQCKNYILSKSNTDLVSFEGTLTSKRFANTLPSYTTKKTKIYGFGTPGSKVHQLVFSYTENDEVKYLDCYLNNWENVLMPLGLIPQMRVVVRNVYPQSNKYLKSSVFTTLEVISYDPLVPFNTVNLYENDQLDWGERSFLGCGNKLPFGVLIWGKVTNVQILSLKIVNRCTGCKCVKENLGECARCCQSTGRELHFLMKMHVSDEFGQSKILVKFPGIMKIILDLQEHQFQVWLKAIEDIGCFEYNFFEDKPAIGRNEVVYFSRCLKDFLKMVNEQAMIFLDMKCRNLDSNRRRNGGRPLWLCVDARRS